MTNLQAHHGRRSGRSTRERIETEALRLFAAKGVHGTSVKDIAHAVGVADAALYRHFKSKDEIASTLFRQHYAALAKEIARIGAEATPFALTARRLVDMFCKLFDDNPDAFRFILMNQHAQLGEIMPDENLVTRLHDIMKAAHSRGEIAIPDPDLAAAIALGAVVQPATFKLYERLPGPMSGRAESISGAILRALGNGSA